MNAATERKTPSFLLGATTTQFTSLPEVNIVLLGALGVGKSALTVKYITKRFISEYDPDLEDTYCKIEVLDQQEVIVRLMDTCYKERREPDRYLKWADSFFVVYSITSRPTFEYAQKYLDLVIQNHRNGGNPECPLVLIGNKVDLERYRQVSKLEGATCAEKYDAVFFETTAAEDYDEVEEVFHKVLRLVLQDQSRFLSLKPLYIAEDKMASNLNRNSLPRNLRSHIIASSNSKLPPVSKDRKPDEKSFLLMDRNPKFKLFNKGFRIFQS
ncbi:ras-like protein family member 12 [Limulus polyphemus]|uniref:small monomeric GTPase n=1 Tax=Limulus polyphemus TaxID=6850 RepID=A0ABM1S9Z5_LIMPO|nr:ras-like protein family member 12 [Limulus polyphemus]